MNDKTHDLVIVGGGLAGAAVATVMARAGADVLVLEKETVFRDRVRGEFLAPWGLRDLSELGLDGVFLEAGAIPLPALAGRTLRPRPVLTPEGDPPLSFSHTAAQEAVLAAACEAGAKVVRGARVTAVTPDGGGRVQFRTVEGPGEVFGRVVVGADGRTSLVRKALGRPIESRSSGRILAGVRLAEVPADPSFGYFVIREEAGGLVSLFPQADGFARAYVFIEGTDASAYAGTEGFNRFIQSMLDLGVPAAALAGARQAGPLASFLSDDSWVDFPASGPLVLVGDAAGISDPTWGQGIALAMHDARVLTRELLQHGDYSDAAARYALERQRYFRSVITAEGWLTDLQLTAGPKADERRAHVLSVWKRHPERGAGLDLPGRGPALDTSEAARRWVFGEDIPLAGSALQPLDVRPEAGVSFADAFFQALKARDFESIAGLVAPDARMRALLPGGPAEFRGPEAAAASFRKWFGAGDDFGVLTTSAEHVADRLRMSWRVRMRWAGEDVPRIVEQQAYSKVVDGRIVVMDLLCSGFRPVADVHAEPAA